MLDSQSSGIHAFSHMPTTCVCMQVACTLHVGCMHVHTHCMQVAYILHAHYRQVACILHVHYMQVACILHAHYMQVACTLQPGYMYTQSNHNGL